MSINQEKQNNLQEWLKSINSLESFTQNGILNGMLVCNIITNISAQSTISLKEVTPSMTTLSRVTNWNILTEELKKFSINITQEQKSKIIAGNQDIAIEIVSKLKEFHIKKEKSTEVDLTQIDPKKDIIDTKSLLEILLILMMKNFHLSAKEAVALLSNESKYLAHILTKGLKGEFKGIENFIGEMNKNLGKIIEFCKGNEENVTFFLRSIKPALISKSEAVSLMCFEFFKRFLENFTLEERIEIFGAHLQSTFWLATKRHSGLESVVIFYTLEGILASKGKEMIINNEISLIEEEKISELREKLMKDVFNSLNEGEKYAMVLSIIKSFKDEHMLKELFEVSFFTKMIVKSIEGIKLQQSSQLCIDIVLSIFQSMPQIFVPQEEDEESKVALNPREISLNLLENLKFIASSEKMMSLPQMIPFSMQLFTLLDNFGQKKHFISPNLYKIILEQFFQIENSNHDLYEIYLLNFMQIIEEFPSIPWTMILENVLNRKKHSEESSVNEIKQIELEFFLLLLQQSTMDIKNALIIFDYVSKLFIQTYHLAGYLIKIMVKIIDLYSRTEEIIDELTSKLIKISLAIHHANAKKFSHKRKSLTGNAKTTDEEALMRIKNNSIEFFVFKVAQLQVQEINSKIEPLVAFNYIQMKEKQEYVKGFKKTLEIIGNFTEIINKYETEIIKAEEETKELQKLEKISKEKEKEKMSQSKIITKAHSKSRYEQDPDSLKKIENYIDDTSHNYKGQSFSMHMRPLNNSYLGVTPSAQKGIEKFQKVFLNKIEKQDFEKIRKQEEEEKFEIMKKIYRKKMVSQYGIDIKGETDQIQYLFEFDSLEGIDEKNSTAVYFYTNETEEDRDMLACEKLIKVYQKPLKVIFSIYSGQKKGQLPQNFDEIAEKNDVLSSSSLFKFLKDFGFEDFISLREVQKLSQKINIELNPTTTDYQQLDFEGFTEFFKQASFLMFTRPPKDLRGQPLALMLEETFSNLKLFAGENKINEQIFEEPSNIFFNETEAVAELNRKLSKNPDYILPEGYKKIVEKKINFEYGIFLEAMSPSYKFVFDVVDELIFNSLGMHVMEPFTREEKITRARPALFVAERLKIDSMPAKHIPVSLKKEIMKIPIKSRTEAKECAIVIDEIITAIELGHTETGLKHMNKIESDKKRQIDNEKRQIEEQKKKRENRNRQTKSAIEHYKEKREEKQKEKSLIKEEEERKIKEEKERKEKEAEELKKKIEEYNKKKKEEEEEKSKRKKEISEEEKKERERLKQLNEETKKKIEEEKKKKEEQENIKKLEKEAEEKKLKELEKKKLMESQTLKKKMVEEFKLRKSQVREVGSALVTNKKNEVSNFANEINSNPISKELKNLESFGNSNNESRVQE